MIIGLTGTRGVLGRRLQAALEARNLSVRPFESDVRDPGAVEQWAQNCRCVVHAAAVVPTVQVGADPGTAIAVNVAGTANVAAAAAKASARLVYISTSHVYRSSADPLSENAPIEPVSLYGLSKWQGEQWAGRLVPAVLIARLFSYFDARQAPSYLVPALASRIAAAPAGAELPLFGYNSVRDIADAAWLAERLADLILANTAGVVNVGTGMGHRISALAQRLATLAGRGDITWVPADDHPGDALVSDATALHGMMDVPEFDLDAALCAFLRDVPA